MVIINTQASQYSNISFRYIIEIQKSSCIFGSARDNETGKSHLFLVFKDGRTYSRNGLRGTWDEILSNTPDHDRIRKLLSSTQANNLVPCYSTHSRVVLN